MIMHVKYKIKTFLFSAPFFLFILLTFFSSCSTINALKQETYTNPEVLPLEQLCPKEILWNHIQDGFEITGYHIPSIKVSWHCVKIDLNTDGLSIAYEPHPSSLGKLSKVKNFARKNKTVVAINSLPFLIETTNYPVGIIKDHNLVVSAPSKKYSAISFYNEENNLRAVIHTNQEAALSTDYIYSFGGFYKTMDNGQIKEFQHNKRSRVGCGISDNGRFLYIFVCTPDFHLTDRNGLNYEECSSILKYLGCDDAMQFDGGHSSALCVYTKDIEKPFLQRKVPTMLGFYIEK